MAQRVLTQVLNRLWGRYSSRVEYARRYVDLVKVRGGRVVKDHIAFRTLNIPTGSQPSGITAIERVFLPFGYRAAGTYTFEDTHLFARHYEHPDPLVPKIFISQLEVDELPTETAAAIRETVAAGEDHLDRTTLEWLWEDDPLDDEAVASLTERVVDFFTRKKPWPIPRADVIREVNSVSQYAAWTLLHGNNVNHFTACINDQNVREWPDIEATAAGLREAGIPMKDQIEGEPGSRLRQTATQAVEVDCPVLDESGQLTSIRWTYAYYEFAERGEVLSPSGRHMRFEGFLGPQAAQLFEMTRR